MEAAPLKIMSVFLQIMALTLFYVFHQFGYHFQSETVKIVMK